MYYICKFSDSWSLYDGKKNSSRPLDKPEVDCVKNLFPALLIDTGNILTALQVTTIPPNKLMKAAGSEEPPMYYICKFTDFWALFDGKRNSSRLLDKPEIDCLKNLFPALLIDTGNILTTLQLITIPPNKLVKVTRSEEPVKTKKAPENVISKPAQGS